MLVAASGSFAAMSFIFASPLIAAVILIEATAIGGAQAPGLAGPGITGFRDRDARVARHRAVLGAEHEGLCARSATAVRAPPPNRGSVRMDDRACDRRRGRDELCDARGAAHPSVRLAPAAACASARDRTDHRWARDRVLADHRQKRRRGSVLRPGPAARTHRSGRNLVAGRAGLADRLQGPGVWPVAG